MFSLQSDSQVQIPANQEAVIGPQQPPLMFNPNDWAIVPYHPPLIQYERIVVGAIKVVYGPVLTSEMAWRRSFEALFKLCPTTEVPL